MLKRLTVLFAILFLLTACGEQKFDGRSDQKFQTSMKAIEQTLNEEQKQNLMNTLLQISLQAALETKGDRQKIAAIIRNKLDGKTAQEVIETYQNKTKE